MPYVFGSVYCATKAALHGYTDTLRLELKPFGVRVVNVVTGGVKSHIARTVRSLKGDSIYLPVEKDFERRLTHSQSLGMETEKYAKSVVEQLTGWRRKTTIWEGSRSWLVWWLTGYMPRFILVSLRKPILDCSHNDD
jgi:1-acylglycerone phosphate reductase